MGRTSLTGNAILDGSIILGVDTNTDANPIMPAQAGNAGKYLFTNGSVISWSTIAGGSLPTQTGNSGKLLTTDGTTASWSDLILLNPSTPTVPTAGGANAISLGNGAVASGQESIVLGGATNTASARYSSALGNQAKSNIYGGFAHAIGMFSVQGDAQTRVFVLRTQTTNATATEMFLDGTGGSQRLVLPNDTTWFFRIAIVARRTDADNESAVYELIGGIDRNTTAGSTALVGTRTRTVYAEDNTAWQVDSVADTTNGSLQINVTGQASKTVNWVARVELTEVTG